MKTDKQNYKTHLFICTNIRKDGTGCGTHQADDLVKELKDWVKSENLKSECKVSRSGCLGKCEKAIVAVCYPQQVWITEATKDDKEQLIQIMKNI